MDEFDRHDAPQVPPDDMPPASEPQETPAIEEAAEPDAKHLQKRAVFYITTAAIAVLLLVISAMDPLVTFLRNGLSILSPLIVGVVIAYLCDPILEFFEYRLFRGMKSGGLRRGLSLLCTVVVAFGVIALILAIMIPQLYKSISELITNYETYINDLLAWLQNIIDKLTANLPIEIDISNIHKLMDFLKDMFGSVENALSQFLAQIQQVASDGNLLGNLWGFLLNAFNTFKNLFLGLFIAFYILASKEKRSAQIRKFRTAMLGEKADNQLEEVITLTDRTFGGFIYGKILDSLVIGILTLVLLTIFDVSPYNMLIATFVGITNIIPVFGPFIGAIPAFFVVLISNPSKAFLFLLLILIIQQLDGNIIGPKILGDNTGISSLCVIIAISVCSALWGVTGMVIGVPVFAVIIEMVKRFLEYRLEANGDPTDTLYYYPEYARGNAEQDLYYEHAPLRYTYEHSKLKPKIDRLRQKLFSHVGRQNHDTRLPDVPDDDDTDDR